MAFYYLFVVTVTTEKFATTHSFPAEHTGQRRPKLAVIGCGAAAVTLLDHLIETLDDTSAVDVTIYEGHGLTATGKPYRDDLRCALLNRQAGQMSVRHNDKAHFHRWISEHDSTVTPDSFVPRTVFGEYLRATLWQAVRELHRRGWSCTIRQERAIALARGEQGYVVTTEQGTANSFDYAALCLGTGEPGDPYALRGTPGFHIDPYPLKDLMPQIPRDASVTVIGTGLAAVDVVAALDQTGHSGRITLASRHGKLPAVRRRPLPHSPRHLHWDTLAARCADRQLTLADVEELFGAELSEMGIDGPPARVRHGRSTEAELVEQLDLVDTPDAWQSLLVYFATTLMARVWHRLDDVARAQFMARYHHGFQCEANPMPAANARRILRLMRNEQLTIAEDVQDVDRGAGGGFSVITGDGTTHADVIVNAVRARHGSVSHAAQPLVQSMASHGFALSHPFGGVYVDPRTHEVLGSRGRAIPGIYALGEITTGNFYYTNSMSVLSTHAEEIVRHLRATASVRR